MDDNPTGEQLPIAVYGTLRVGQHNHRFVAGRIGDIETGTVDSHELVVDGLPFARPASIGNLVVEVMWPLPNIYDEVLADLDRLEGYHPEQPETSFYLRTEVTVHTPAGDVEAWLYEAGTQARHRLGQYPPVESGDFVALRRRVGEEVA